MKFFYLKDLNILQNSAVREQLQHYFDIWWRPVVSDATHSYVTQDISQVFTILSLNLIKNNNKLLFAYFQFKTSRNQTCDENIRRRISSTHRRNPLLNFG